MKIVGSLRVRTGRFAGRGLPRKLYGSIGSMDVRLATSNRDVRLAQRLRYKVFFEEMSAVPNLSARMRRRDEDEFDAVCDHLLVEDNAPCSVAHATSSRWHARRPLIAGTYRILRGDMASRKNIEFYTQSEYDVASLISAKGSDTRFMELGRSCVLKPYRNKRTVELLWHGLWTYARQHSVDVMIGCASFEGTEPDSHALALSYLHHYARAPAEWSVSAHARLHRDMDVIPVDQINEKAALKAMPPLIKGYLRLGAFVGDGAVVDYQFGTTDVLIILPVAQIDPRYYSHFGSPDERVSRVLLNANKHG